MAKKLPKTIVNKKRMSLGGRVVRVGRKLANFVRNLGGRFRLGRDRKPKGTSGRAGGQTSRRMAQAGRGGR